MIYQRTQTVQNKMGKLNKMIKIYEYKVDIIILLLLFGWIALVFIH